MLLLALGNTFVATAQIEFTENKGQWDPKVKFMSSAGAASFFLEAKGYTVSQHHAGDIANVIEARHQSSVGAMERQEAVKVRSHAYSVEFVGARDAKIQPEKALQTVSNYFYGDDPTAWVTGVSTYQAVTFKEIYPNIDIRYFMDEGKNLKYDFIVHPGGKVSDIVMKYSGAQKLQVRKRELVITTSLGDDRSLRPYTFQAADTGRMEVDCRYELNKEIVTFKVGAYDKSRVLVIDPTQIFFTYSGSAAANYGFTATYGPDGSFFGGGIVFGAGFPVSPGAHAPAFQGGEYDIGIIKLSPDGSERIYATYIGGSGLDQPHSLVVDGAGNLVLAGRTNSTNYPVVPARNPATSGPGGGYDIVVTKLSADGSAILGSMRIGGANHDGVNIGDRSESGAVSLRRNYGDDARSEVLLDGAGNIYVASCTKSGADFPTTAGVIGPAPLGGQDAVLLKLDPTCRNILFSTRLGGSDDDAAYVLAMGPNNNVYVAGATQSADFTGIPSSGVIQPSFAGQIDGFVVELNNQGTAVRSGTYVGTQAVDEVYGLDVDNLGYPYLMGTTHGNMPVKNANYSVAGAKQFIWKMEPDLSNTIYQTTYGSANATVPNISPTAFMVDRCENVYVSGWGGKANRGFSGGSVTGMPVAGDNILKERPDGSGSDFHFFVLERDARSQLYGTFFGQNDPMEGAQPQTYGDHVDGGTSRFDSRGYIYQSMCFQHIPNRSYPGTLGSWSRLTRVPAGSYSIGMLKIEMDFTGVRANLQVTMNGIKGDTVGCVPQLVQFKDLERTNRGKRFYWDFGDGQADTTTTGENQHLYDVVGSYLVRLIAEDSATCNVRDTVYQRIYLGNNRVRPDFKAQKNPPCENLTYTFQNTSVSLDGQPFKPNTFRWDFGDGSTYVTSSFNDVVTHTYAAPGTYNVTLRVNDVDFCNSPADTVKVIRISTLVKADFETPARGCVPYTAQFNNTSLGGTEFLWDFGDGNTSTDDSPTHLYTNPGTYLVRLLANDPNSCNLTDQTSFTITVSAGPTAAFDFVPLQPVENAFTEFYNRSSGAVKYLWDFGDGTTDSVEHPKHIFPATGDYNVCLTAINEFGCADTTCREVKAIIKALLDVPNAFTPGKFGVNSTIGVEGYGIQEMEWTIYNRWGQKVFVGNDRKMRWDGTFNGKPLPMDVYTYTLRATFTDGTKTTKTGDITLIR